MITRGLDGSFYDIPDNMADEYKISAEDAQAKLGTQGGALPNAPAGMSMGGMGMGTGQEMMSAPPGGGSPQGVVINIINPTAVQNPMMGGPQGPQPQQGGQPQGPQALQAARPEAAEAGGGAGAGAAAVGGGCYSCYCYNCYSCYCYHCYCYRTCYSCYIQPV